MNENYPGWEESGEWVRTNKGVYIQWMERNEGTALADTVIKEGNWVRIDYTGKTLDGNIFYTRDAEVAKVQGTFSRRAHYVDDFVYLYSNNGALAAGMFEALTRMKVGDMTKVVIPSDMYKGSTGYNTTNVGYNGQWGVDGNKPVIQGGPTGAPISEEIYTNVIRSYAQEPVVDTIVSGIINTVDGHPASTNSPWEIMATMSEIRKVREATTISGRCGMGI